MAELGTASLTVIAKSAVRASDGVGEKTGLAASVAMDCLHGVVARAIDGRGTDRLPTPDRPSGRNRIGYNPNVACMAEGTAATDW